MGTFRPVLRTFRVLKLYSSLKNLKHCFIAYIQRTIKILHVPVSASAAMPIVAQRICHSREKT